MLKSIGKLKGFGVFDTFISNEAVQDFAPKNIIYGWNYSGKTTLSRFFSMLGSKAPSADFPTCSFSVTDSDGNEASNTIPTAWIHPIAVFNSNFIGENLRWDGSLFQPILLLGEDSIEAQSQLDICADQLSRILSSSEEKRARQRESNESIANARTAHAKLVKQALGLVDAYTATHLSADLSALDSQKLDRLDATAVAQNLTLVNTSVTEKLPAVSLVTLGNLGLYQVGSTAKKIVLETPALSKTLEYLEDNLEVSAWVEHGLTIHEGKDSCEFCKSDLTFDRIEALRAHFSKDFAQHRNKIASASNAAIEARLDPIDVVAVSLSPQFRSTLPDLLACLNNAILEYGSALEEIIKSLANKAAAPYAIGEFPETLQGLDVAVSESLNSVNALLTEHNELSDEFPKRKAEAIQALKKDFAIEFFVANELPRTAVQKLRLDRHLVIYSKMEVTLRSRVLELKAKISQAQKGREEINSRIISLLGTDSIQINVVSSEGEDRFQLIRRGVVARNLSDGERTAVAFAFFLTKLREHKNFDELIVYIDDPISSLDSNHIFQIFAIINKLFFEQDEVGQKQWRVACRQLFISTHNFEFFTLLRKLPAAKNHNTSRYFLVRRLSPSQSTIANLPDSIGRHTSEYHYLFGVLRKFSDSANKQDLAVLLMLPNAVRRFLELYTYARLPLADSTVDSRAQILFGVEKGARVVKLLHYFSHLESVDRLAANPDVISNISEVIEEIFALVKEDKHHFEALEASLV